MTTDIPEPRDLETWLEVGSWTWGWMEPPLGQRLLLHPVRPVRERPNAQHRGQAVHRLPPLVASEPPFKLIPEVQQEGGPRLRDRRLVRKVGCVGDRADSSHTHTHTHHPVSGARLLPRSTTRRVATAAHIPRPSGPPTARRTSRRWSTMFRARWRARDVQADRRDVAHHRRGLAPRPHVAARALSALGCDGYKSGPLPRRRPRGLG